MGERPRNNRFDNKAADGLNKIGQQKSVFPIDVPGVGVRIVLNGFVPGYRALFTDPRARCVAIHASTPERWQYVRDSVVGDNSSPKECLPGSIRNDAWLGRLPLDPDDDVVNGQRNVCHSSATLVDGMRELCLWFDYGYDETVLGQLCRLHDFDPEALTGVHDLPWTTRDDTIDELLFDFELRDVKARLQNRVEFDRRLHDYVEAIGGRQETVERAVHSPALQAFVEDGLRFSRGGPELFQHAVATRITDPPLRSIFTEVARRIAVLADRSPEHSRPDVVAEAYKIAAGDLMLLTLPAYATVANVQLFRASVVGELAEQALACAARVHSNFIRDLRGLLTDAVASDTRPLADHPEWQAFAADARTASVDGEVAVIVLAGGRSTRMESTIPKPVLPLRDSLLLNHLHETIQHAAGSGASVFAAVGFRAGIVEKAIGNRMRYLHHPATLGLGFRVATALETLKAHEGLVLIAYADMPDVSPTTLDRALDAVTTSRTFALVESASDLSGHIIKEDGRVTRIVQSRYERPPNEEHQRDVGVYAFHNTPEFRRILGTLENDNARGEYIFADVAERLAASGWDIPTVEERPERARGVNTPADLLSIASGLSHHRSGGAAEIGAAKAELDECCGIAAEGATSLQALQTLIDNHVGPTEFFDWWNELWA